MRFNREITAVITSQDFDAPDEGNIDDLNSMSFSAGLQYRFKRPGRLRALFEVGVAPNRDSLARAYEDFDDSRARRPAR